MIGVFVVLVICSIFLGLALWAMREFGAPAVLQKVVLVGGVVILVVWFLIALMRTLGIEMPM